MSSVFQKSYSRGVMDTLVRAGVVKTASVEEAEKIADAAADSLDVEPIEVAVPEEKVAALIMDLMEKSATGNLITGDKSEQKNTPQNAAKQVGGLAALDEKQRPQGTYAKGEKGVGKTDMKVPANAEIGHEQPHPCAPGNTDHKPNSLKSAADLGALLRKVAEGTGNLITGDKKEQQNTPENAASEVGGLGALDQKQRPQGEYAKGEKGVGHSEMPVGEGEVGKEEKHPHAPGNTDSKSNTANKSAAYVARFEETAREYVGQLPAGLDDDEKVAAVKHLMGLEPEEAEGFLGKLAEEAGEHPGLEEAKKEHEAKETKEEEAEEHMKGEEKKEEAKKEASVKEAAPHRRKYQDPYGYKKYDAVDAGQGQRGPQQAQQVKKAGEASNILAALRSLSAKK